MNCYGQLVGRRRTGHRESETAAVPSVLATFEFVLRIPAKLFHFNKLFEELIDLEEYSFFGWTTYSMKIVSKIYSSIGVATKCCGKIYH